LYLPQSPRLQQARIPGGGLRISGQSARKTVGLPVLFLSLKNKTAGTWVKTVYA
jgi:hypothetical protein